MSRRRPLDRVELSILRAVRAGAENASEVAEAAELSASTVIHAAQGLVSRRLLCALDGEPWAVRLEALPLLEGAPC